MHGYFTCIGAERKSSVVLIIIMFFFVVVFFLSCFCLFCFVFSFLNFYFIDTD